MLEPRRHAVRQEEGVDDAQRLLARIGGNGVYFRDADLHLRGVGAAIFVDAMLD